MAYFNCLNSLKAGPNPLNSSNSRSWIFSSLHGLFCFQSCTLFALSHILQTIPWENPCADPCPGQAKSSSNLEDGPTLKVSNQNVMRGRHYATEQGEVELKLREVGLIQRKAGPLGSPQSLEMPDWEGHHLAGDTRTPLGLLALSSGLRKIMPHQWSWVTAPENLSC